MRRLPLAILALAALAPRLAAADDGAIIRRKPVAPIAGAPIWPEKELEGKPRKAKIPGLVIAGGILGGLGAAGAIAGLVMMNSGGGSCTTTTDTCPAGLRDPGITTLLISSSVAALGLTFVLVGIQPADEPEKPAAARALPTITVGPTGGALTWRF